MDVALFELIKKADSGDGDAIIDLAIAYLSGAGTKEEPIKAREYLQKLVDADTLDIYEFEYGGLYKIVADMFQNEKNYKAAHRYYVKAKEFIWGVYHDDYAQELSEKLKLEQLIKDTECIFSRI